MSTPLRPNIWPERLDSAKRQIRLLLLEPSPHCNTLPRGKLVTASLNYHPRYVAISHAWGGPQKSLPLIVDGVRIPITEELCACLMAVRHSSSEQAFWIDAISINQSDLDERAEQVQLMQTIFSGAAYVHVWLGHGSPKVRQAMLEISRLVELRINTSDIPQMLQIPWLEKTSVFTTTDWWYRLWPRQEVVLAKDLVFQYDEHVVNMKVLNAFIDLYRQRHCSYLLKRSDPGGQAGIDYDSSLEKLLHLSHLRNLLNNALTQPAQEKMKQVLEVLLQCRTARVADPKDRVYGLLGICTAFFGTDLMEANYSLSTAKVFSQFAIALIRASGSLMLLNQASPLQNSLADLPSFVPDWTSAYDFRAEHGRSWMLKVHNATKHLPLDLKAESSERLSLCACVLSRVKHTSASMELGVGRDGLRRIFNRWATDYKNWSAISSTPGNDPFFTTDLEAFAMTMFRGCPGARPTFVKIIGLEKVTMRYVDVFKYMDDPNTDAEVGEAMYSATIHSRFFITSNGLPALGPIDTQEGDTVALLRGGNVPYVLRRCTDKSSPDRYHFVGECYVYGAMNGERCPPDEQWGTVTII